MDSIRMGNTVHVNFSCIDKTTQQAIDLSTVEKLSVSVAAKDVLITQEYTLSGGNIVINIDKKKQTEHGVYRIIVTFVLNGDDYAYDKALFKIVGSSDEATFNVPNDAEVITIPVQGVVDFISDVKRDYNELTNKPSIAGVVLKGDSTLAELGIASVKDLLRYVEKRVGYDLMSDAERAKLQSLENYDDAAVWQAIRDIIGEADESPRINTLAEMAAFLDGYTTADKLINVVNAVIAKIPTKAIQIGADSIGSAEAAFADAKRYTNTEVNKVIDYVEKGLSTTVKSVKIGGEIKIPINGMVDLGDGGIGENGATFTPSVTEAGVISWTNDGGLPNPNPVNIKGAKGDDADIAGANAAIEAANMAANKAGEAADKASKYNITIGIDDNGNIYTETCDNSVYDIAISDNGEMVVTETF